MMTPFLVSLLLGFTLLLPLTFVGTSLISTRVKLFDLRGLFAIPSGIGIGMSVIVLVEFGPTVWGALLAAVPVGLVCAVLLLVMPKRATRFWVLGLERSDRTELLDLISGLCGLPGAIQEGGTPKFADKVGLVVGRWDPATSITWMGVSRALTRDELKSVRALSSKRFVGGGLRRANIFATKLVLIGAIGLIGGLGLAAYLFGMV